MDTAHGAATAAQSSARRGADIDFSSSDRIAVARRWLAAIRADSPLDLADDVATELLAGLLHELQAATDVADSDPVARAIGAKLAAAPFEHIRIMAPTVEVLIGVTPVEHAAGHRWARVLAQAFDSYADALRERSLRRQELILAAAVSARTGEVIALQEQLLHQANHDPLTGLANRTHLLEYVESSSSEHIPLGVWLIDLDEFKYVNDRYGHPVGDEVLVVFAQRLRSFAERCAHGLAARYGGDEFVMIARATESEVVELAERLTGLLPEPCRTSSGPIEIAASIGYAWHDGSTPVDFATLLRTADQAMYRIKATHRPGCSDNNSINS